MLLDLMFTTVFETKYSLDSYFVVDEVILNFWYKNIMKKKEK